MAPQVQIPVTTANEHLLEAAQLLSSHLHQLGIDHAYVGGFALLSLGSRTPDKL